MHSTSAKSVSLSLKKAEEAAERICLLLNNYCVRIQVAGSIRRKRPLIHDIDLVAIPRFVHGQPIGLFGDVAEKNELDVALGDLACHGRIQIKKRGEKILRLLFADVEVPVDLYIATQETWATLLLIRTGSKEHNIFLCSRARQLGMRLKADGSGLLRNNNLVASDSEQSIFSALNVSYAPPEDREIPGRAT